MPRPHRVRPFFRLAVVAAVAAGLSGCVTAPPPTAVADEATPEPAASPTAAAACIERARVVDVEEARAYYENALLGLRAERQYTYTFNGRYAIGFEAETFWVEPAYDVWLSDGSTIVDVRQTGRLTGRYTIEDGVISTSDVVDSRTSDPAVDPSTGTVAAIARTIMEHNPIEGARASCEGDDLVLDLSEPGSGHTTVHLPAA